MSRSWRIAFCLPALVLAGDSGSDGHRWWSYVSYLADDKLEGRNTGSQGYQKAATYVAGEFERAGLKPAGVSGYFQPVRFRSRRILEDQSGLALVRNGKTEPLKLGEDAYFNMRVEPAPEVEAPIVFVGYGLSVPEMNFDDFAGLDLKGKVAFYVSGGPSNIPGPLRSHYQSNGERWKALQKAGAIGAISVQNPKHMDIPWARSTLARLQASMSLTEPSLDETAGEKILVTFNPAHAEKLFAGSGHTFAGILAAADAGKPLPRFPLSALIKAKARFEAAEVESPNVAAVRPGADARLKNEYVVLSAHLDHLGIGQPIHGDRIYNGAMDNASGVASLLDIAARLRETKPNLKRSLLFLAVTAEEKGLLGSKYFAAHPTAKPNEIVANINLDMFLPLFPLKLLTVYGLDESDLGNDIRQVAKPLGVEIQADQEPNRNIFIRSDQYNFIRHGIPALSFKLGYEKGSPEAAIVKKWLTERYHAPSDDVHQPVDLKAAADFDNVILHLVEVVADRAGRPKWNPQSFFRRYAD